MSDLLLTEEERIRFAEYLEREAASDEAMIKQMESIGAPKEMIKRYRTQMVASGIVAARLRSIEDMSI